MSVGCGACNLCCKLLAVPDINKPARMLCEHTTVHGGCALQHKKDTEPSLQACKQFKCVWLMSQENPDETFRGSRALRPDMCHVVIGPPDLNDHKLIYVQVDPDHPGAWREPMIQNYMDECIAKGARFEIIIDELHFPWPEISADTNADAQPTS